MKVKDHFKWTNRFYNDFDLNKAFELSKKFNLDINKRFEALSKGYQSIFKLIIALSLNVPYVIFDEPVLGLDVNHRELFYSLLLKEFENNERTLIIATHLIEEVSNIIEEVVLIDKGKFFFQETVENCLKKDIAFPGWLQEVDHYCEGKNVIGYDELGSLKIAYVLGEKTALPQGSNLQVTAMNLQKLFVKMTEKGGGENE
ncbi:MAG: AAA family ATPase [Waltera sp.]